MTQFPGLGRVVLVIMVSAMVIVKTRLNNMASHSFLSVSVISTNFHSTSTHFAARVKRIMKRFHFIAIGLRHSFGIWTCTNQATWQILCSVLTPFVLVAESRVDSAIRAIRAEGRSQTSPDSPRLRFQESDVALWETKNNIYTRTCERPRRLSDPPDIVNDSAMLYLLDWVPCSAISDLRSLT
ncbi:hypothetical protein CCUS01_08137 [Colletotrichum cuscutae]|uniref:Uncharacterized protein n=1 Tax=Colletotrichum cuscutae TaxID=1209917 RepID=A0AAI9UU98_9PEZI|nr:hypothetical protein CCUS01_08137 [Colletotrichum cuscutae]